MSEEILAGLTSIANNWRWLAIAWHALLASLLVALLVGWKPSTRLLSQLLVAPIVSVAVVAGLSGNPFNGITFAMLAGTLVWARARFSSAPVCLASRVSATPALALVIFGWTYPHFLRTDSWTPYLYASPFGLLPCPTMSVVIGLTLLIPTLHSRRWCTALGVAGLMYGAFGVFRLGVVLDLPLVFASAFLLAVGPRVVWRSVRADHAERTQSLPGDELIPQPLATLTHAITISGSREAVWPWLVQMGAGSRAGWYSYDVLDNGRQRSATRLVPALQTITTGTVFPALPGVTDGFVVLALAPSRSLILGWPGVDGAPTVTWAFVLQERADGGTRLIVRVRGSQDYRFHGLPRWLSRPTVRFVHYLMQRKQLLGIARRVELPALMSADMVVC